MSLQTANETALARLKERFPWPEERPDFPDREYGWGISDEDLLLSHLPEEASCILEIGSFLGGSARFFANARPQATIICVDPWMDTHRPFVGRNAPELTEWLAKPDGCYQTFLSSNWGYRERIVALRGFSPEALLPVFETGCRPDFIYIDGAHHYEAVLMDLCTCQVLFPDAVISGDDWRWSGLRIRSRILRQVIRYHPIQRAVKYFASRYKYKVHASKNTWVLSAGESRPTFEHAHAI